MTSSLRALNPELQEVACTKLNEVNTRIPEDVETLRSWILNEPHLKARTDDQFLLAFLRYCKFDMETAKKRVEYFYGYKTSAKDLLKNRQVNEKILDIGRSGIFYTLPKPMGPGGPRLHCVRMGNINPSVHSVKDLFAYYVMRCEIQINSDDNWNICGFVEIVDFSKISFGFLKQYDGNLFRQMANLLEYGIPSDLLGTHIVNASREAQIILVLVRNVMKQKNLLNIHSTLESLQEAIGKEYLPVEYGGTNGSLEEAEENYEQVLLQYKNYFEEDDQYGVDEKLKKVGNTSQGQSTLSSLLKLVID